MIKAYDIAVKKLIEVFTNKIPVYGLQNEDSTENFESVMTQAGNETEGDKIPFPMISVFRDPKIEIVDDSRTKRASTSEGYTYISDNNKKIGKLVSMRAKLRYIVDVFDVSRASAEEIALKLYFRLRNNPQVTANFYFKEICHPIKCIADIEMEGDVTNIRVQSKDTPQIYKFRFTFDLVNVNLYDLIIKDRMDVDIRFRITVELAEEVDFQ